MLQLDGWTAVIADRWLLTLLHFLWQGTIIAIAHMLVLRLVRPHTAAARYLLTLATFVLLLAAPAATVLTIDPPPRPLPQQQSVTSSPASAGEWDALADEALSVDPLQVADDWLGPAHESAHHFPARTTAPIPAAATELDNPSIASGRNHPLTELLYRWQPTLLTAWLAGVVLLGLRLLVSFVRTLRLIRDRQPVSAALAQRADAIAHRMALSRTPRLFLSPRLREAIVTGYLRPLVLLPVAWATELPCEVLDAVIAHELAHIRRYDLWVILLQRLAETLLFYHPAVWWLSRSLSRERELCCDALAVQATGSAIDYAVALEHVAHRLRGLTPPARWNHILSPALGGQKMELLNRVQHVLAMTEASPFIGRRKPPAFTPRAASLPQSLAGIVVLIVLATTVWGYLATQTSRDSFVEIEAALPPRAMDQGVAELVEARPIATDAEGDAQASPSHEPEPAGNTQAPPPVDTTEAATETAPPRSNQGRPIIDTADGPAIEYPIGDEVSLYPATPGAPVAESPIAFALSAEELAAAAKIEQLGGRIDLLYGVRTEALADARVRATILRNELVWNVQWDGDVDDAPAAPATGAATPRLSDELLTALGALQPRVALFLGPHTVTNDDLSRLSSVPQLRRVNLEGPQDVSGQGLEHLSRLPRLEALAWITPCTDGDLSHLRGMISLTHLTLDASQLTDQGIASLARMPHLQSLQSLGLVRCQQLTRACVQEIAALPNLQTLSLGGFALSPADLAPLKSLTLLEQFTFCPSLSHDAQTTEATATAVVRDTHLTEFRSWPHLRMMTLSPCRLSRETLESLRDWGPRDQSAPGEAPGVHRMLTLPQLYLNDCMIVEPDGREVHYDLVRLLPDRTSNTPISNPVEAPLPARLTITYEQRPRSEVSLADDAEEQKAAEGTKTQEVKGEAIEFAGLSARDFRIRANTIDASLGKLTVGDFRCTYNKARIHVASDSVLGTGKFPTIQRLQLTGGVVTIAGEPEYGIQADELDIEFDAADQRPLTIAARGQVNVWERQSTGISNCVRADRMELQLADRVPRASFSMDAAPPAAATSIEETGPAPGSNADIFRGLDERVDVEFLDTPLHDALQRLAQDHLGGRLKIDPDGLRTAGVSEQRPVNLVVSGISLRSALKLILQPLDLDWTVSDGSLNITSRWQVREQLQARVYSVADLVTRPSDNPQPRPVDPSLLEPLSELILSTVEPNAWSEQGGSGSITPHPATLSLVIRARPETHQQIADLLSGLRRLQAQTGVVEFAAAQATPGSTPARIETNLERTRRLADAAYEATLTAADRQIRDQLHEPCTLEVANEPLAKVLAALSTRQQVNIVVDNAGLAECGITADQPVTLRLRDVPLETALRVLLEPHGLRHTIDCEVLKITSQLRAEGQPLVLYRCGGLLAGSPHPMPDLRRYADLIEMTIAPDSWSGLGGLGAISVHESTSSLVVRQSPANHRQIAHLLGNLERVRSGGQPHLGPLPPQSEANRKVLEQLRQARLAPNFQSMPLQDVMRTLAEQFAVNLWLDPHGLTEADVTPATPVTLSLAELPAHEALDRLLQPLGLAWCVEDGLIVVSSPRRCSGAPATQVYVVDWWLDAHADGQPARDLRTLAATIEGEVHPDSWSTTGGWGRIQWDGRTRTLIVYHTLKQQRQVASYLAGLRMQTEPAR